MTNPFYKNETAEEEIRFKGFEAIYEILLKNKIVKTKANKIAVKIERGIYDKSMLNIGEKQGYLDWKKEEIRNEYSVLIYSIMTNLDTDGQVEGTKPKEILGENDINDLINMDIKDLAPIDVWKDSINELTARQSASVQPKIDGNSKFFCKKCRSKNIVVTTAQLRGADEATNIIITCQDCNFVSIK